MLIWWNNRGIYVQIWPPAEEALAVSGRIHFPKLDSRESNFQLAKIFRQEKWSSIKYTRKTVVLRYSPLVSKKLPSVFAAETLEKKAFSISIFACTQNNVSFHQWGLPCILSQFSSRVCPSQVNYCISLKHHRGKFNPLSPKGEQYTSHRQHFTAFIYNHSSTSSKWKQIVHVMPLASNHQTSRLKKFSACSKRNQYVHLSRCDYVKRNSPSSLVQTRYALFWGEKNSPCSYFWQDLLLWFPVFLQWRHDDKIIAHNCNFTIHHLEIVCSKIDCRSGKFSFTNWQVGRVESSNTECLSFNGDVNFQHALQ